MPRRYRPADGFTMVELVIVILTLAIAAALAVPRLGNASSTQLRSAARLVAADLDAARIESLAHGDDPRVVVFDLDANRYHLAASSAPTVPFTNPMDKKPYAVTFGSGRAAALTAVTLSAVGLGDGDDRTLGFGVYGQLDQPTDATVTLAADGATVTLTVDATTGETTVGDIE